MVARKLLKRRSPSFTLLWLLTGTALYLVSSLPAQAADEPATSLSDANPRTMPRTLKEAKISAVEILGQAPETPAVPAPSDPSTATPTSAYTSIPIRGGASFNSGPGVGYESSFFGLEGFVPLTQTPGKNLTYAQGRLLLDTNGGNPGGNVAVGYRDFDPSSGRILGGYVGVDVRDTGRTTFSQLGAGVEAVFPGFEFRVNGYLPVGDRRREVASQSFSNTASTSNTSTSLSGGTGTGTTAPTNIRFQGNSLLFDSPTTASTLTTTTTTTTRNQTTRFTRALDEVSLAGLDAEAGVKLAQLSPGSDLRSYLGLYYYSGEGVSGFVGVRGRLALRLNDTVTAGLAVQGDREFGTTAVATVSLQFPTIGRKTTGQPADNWARVGDSAIRNQAVAVTERTRTSTSTSTQVTQDVQTSTQTVGSGTGGTIIVQNPATGQPYVFQHAVLGAAVGNGTFENPFSTLLAAITAAPGDGNGIVYVQAGTNPGIPAFTIKDGVQVLSSGVAQTLATVQAGNLQLPLSGTGALPRVAGTVTMGNNTTLGGFNITGFVGLGVFGRDLRNVTIQDNVITNLGGNDGIVLDGNLTGAVTIRRNAIGAGTKLGMFVAPGQVVAAPLTIDISNNTVQNTSDTGIRVFPVVNTTATATIANNTVTNTPGTGIDAISLDNSSLRVQIDNNQINNVQVGFGARIGIRVFTVNAAQLFASITNNRVTNPNAFTSGTQVEYLIVSDGSGTLCSRLLNNTASVSGYEFRRNAGTLQREPLVGNIGTVQPDGGVITPVAAGTCGF